jgi:ribosomal protein S18 acetylase RimI-like enzyme
MNEATSVVTVRAARVADEDAILALAHAEMEAQARVDDRFRLRSDARARYALYLRDRMHHLDSAVFVAEEGESVVGLIIGSVRTRDSFFELRRFGYVSDLVVDPASRRRGIGCRLYHRVAEWLAGHGLTVARMHVAIRSESARAFWRAQGAEDFLAESWIDLPKTPDDGGSDSETASTSLPTPVGSPAHATGSAQAPPGPLSGEERKGVEP